MTELSVLIVNYNSWRVLVAALESLAAHPPHRADGTPMAYEVIVVDNCSPQRDDEAEARVRELIAAQGGELVMHDQNGGYSTGMNLARAHSKGRWLLISNPDVEFAPGCLDALLRYHEDHPSCGAAAPEGFWDRGFDCRLPPNILPTLGDLTRLTLAALSPGWARRYSRKRTPEAVRVWDATGPIELDMLSGCCFLIERAFFDAIGRFDEGFPLYYEDTDLSMRVRKAGKRVVQVHGARLVHLYNRSGQTDHDQAMARYWVSRRYYYRKWYGRLGALYYDLTQRLLRTGWAKRRAARAPQPRVRELGDSYERPQIEMPAHLERYLVEVSLDPHFYLAAGILGSGSSWSPSDAVFENFGPTTYFFRVVDLSGGRCEELGVYRYTRVYPDEWLQPAEAG